MKEIEKRAGPFGREEGQMKDDQGRGLSSLALLVKLLEDSIPIPGLKRRIGLDALIGLIPGFGDAIGATISAYIVWEGVRLGVPAHLAFKMILNVAIDSILGVIPLFGDLFDAGWRSNTKNLAIINNFLREQSENRVRSPEEVRVVLLVVLGASLLAFVILLVLVLRFLVRLIVG